MEINRYIIISSLLIGCMDSTNADCEQNGTFLFCQNQISDDHFHPTPTTLHLDQLLDEMLDFDWIFTKFANLENLTITNTNFSEYNLPEGRNQLKHLHLRNIRIEYVGTNFLASFPLLRTLDLRENRLQSMNEQWNTHDITHLYLNGNLWNCAWNLDWVLNLDVNIVKDLDELICHGTLHEGKPLYTIATFQCAARRECPDRCHCNLPKVVRNLATHIYEPIIEVNCTNLELIEFPTKLPNQTKILHLEMNEIHSVNELNINPIYQTVIELYLDDNRIESIDELEGSFWLRQFRMFSLSGNRLTEIPTYALDNALQQNPNMPDAVRIYLGNNPWRCDCIFTPVFQGLLQKYQKQIADNDEIACSYVEGDDNSFLRINELSRSSVCRLPTEYSIQALDFLNGILASLIILVLGKLAYDYYHFKKTGKLPWIVTKMP